MMGLTQEQIQQLYANKSKPKEANTTETATKRPKKFIRRQTQYPDFPKDGPVTWHDTYPPYPKLHCAARGCRVDTPYKYRGIPYCSLHILHYLALEITELTRWKESLNGNGNQASQHDPNDYF
jgi:hypothetical protein